MKVEATMAMSSFDGLTLPNPMASENPMTSKMLTTTNLLEAMAILNVIVSTIKYQKASFMVKGKYSNKHLNFILKKTQGCKKAERKTNRSKKTADPKLPPTQGETVLKTLKWPI